jgi:hypothetical protein
LKFGRPIASTDSPSASRAYATSLVSNVTVSPGSTSSAGGIDASKLTWNVSADSVCSAIARI